MCIRDSLETTDLRSFKQFSAKLTVLSWIRDIFKALASVLKHLLYFRLFLLLTSIMITLSCCMNSSSSSHPEELSSVLFKKKISELRVQGFSKRLILNLQYIRMLSIFPDPFLTPFLTLVIELGLQTNFINVFCVASFLIKFGSLLLLATRTLERQPG